MQFVLLCLVELLTLKSGTALDPVKSVDPVKLLNLDDDYMRRIDEEVRKYIRQPVIGQYMFELEVNRVIDGRYLPIYETGKLKTVLCNHIFDQLRSNWGLYPKYDSICEIARESHHYPFSNVYVHFSIQQYELYVYNVWNNEKDFEMTMKDLLTTDATNRENWKVFAANIYTRSEGAVIGQVMSVASYEVTSKCVTFSKVCDDSYLQMPYYLRLMHESNLCRALRKYLSTKNPKLENLIKGCWFSISNHNFKIIYATLSVHYPWHLVHTYRGFADTKEFVEHMKEQLVNLADPDHGKIFLSINAHSKYDDSFRALSFGGYLLQDGADAQWNEKYQLTNSDMYKNTFRSLKSEFTKRISADQTISGINVEDIKINKIRQHSGKVFLIGCIRYRKTENAERTDSYRTARDQIKSAWEKGESSMQPTIIKDLVFKESQHPYSTSSAIPCENIDIQDFEMSKEPDTNSNVEEADTL